MIDLPHKHPQFTDFLKGNFIVHKSDREFSPIGNSQSHEQSNKDFQANVDAVDLYGNSEALTLFMLAVSDCTQCIEEFESVLVTTKTYCSS
jgi:hypothetical protein